MQRQLETRMRVVRTLDRLMQSTPIDKIKVTDLCREADIGRATFYEYFENIYAVATWYYSHLLDQSLYLIGEGVDFQTAHVRLFESLLQDRSFFTRAFRSSDYNSVYNYGNRIIADHYLQIIPQISGKPLLKKCTYGSSLPGLPFSLPSGHATAWKCRQRIWRACARGLHQKYLRA